MNSRRWACVSGRRAVSLGPEPTVISIWRLKDWPVKAERMRANSRPWRRKASSVLERRRSSQAGVADAG